MHKLWCFVQVGWAGMSVFDHEPKHDPPQTLVGGIISELQQNTRTCVQVQWIWNKIWIGGLLGGKTSEGSIPPLKPLLDHPNACFSCLHHLTCI